MKVYHNKWLCVRLAQPNKDKYGIVVVAGNILLTFLRLVKLLPICVNL